MQCTLSFNSCICDLLYRIMTFSQFLQREFVSSQFLSSLNSPDSWILLIWVFSKCSLSWLTLLVVELALYEKLPVRDGRPPTPIADRSLTGKPSCSANWVSVKCLWSWGSASCNLWRTEAQPEGHSDEVVDLRCVQAGWKVDARKIMSKIRKECMCQVWC